MSLSPLPPGLRRARLGSPMMPVNASGAYLRHRAAAARIERARRRTALRRRALVVIGAALFYLLIGHELVQLTRAKARLLSTEVRSDAHRLAKDLGSLVQPGRLQADPPAVPEARALASERAGAEALREQP